MLVVVGAVVAASVASGLGARIGGDVLGAVCRIVGGHCAPTRSLAEPKDPCAQAIEERKVAAGVTIASVHAGAKLAFVVERRSNGTWAVTVRKAAEGGIEGEVGAKGTVATGKGKVGAGVSAKGSAVAQVDAGNVYVFGSRKDADQFVTSAEQQALADAGGIPARLAYDIWGAVTGDGYDPPSPEETYGKAGAVLKGSAEGVLGLARSGADAEMAESVGAKYNHLKKETTIYYELTAAAAGDAGVELAGGAIADGDGSVVLGLVLDSRNRPKSLTVEAAGGYGSGFGLEGTFDGMRGVAGAVRKAKADGGVAAGRAMRFTAELDLRDPANAEAAQAVLSSVAPNRWPALPAAVSRLVDRFEEAGTMTMAVYDTSRTKYGLDVSGGLAVKFGLSGDYEGLDERLLDASYRVPGQGFVQWKGCIGG